MSWGFTDSLIFAAIMTMHDMSKERAGAKKLIKTQNFYQSINELITDESMKTFEMVKGICSRASRCYIPKEILSEIKYLPLYAFGLVISKQRRITHEQHTLLKFYTDNLSLPFSQSQFESAMKTNAPLCDFQEVIELTSTKAGTFWVQLFHALYKAGTQTEFQEITDCVTSMVMRFSVLGNPNSNDSIGICEEFIHNANKQIQKCREISFDEIDWFGAVSISERMSEMRSMYQRLVTESNISDDVNVDELFELFDMMILNSICDLVMMTKLPAKDKLSAIKEAVSQTEIIPQIEPDQYVKDKANHSPSAESYDSFFKCSHNRCGMFWGSLLIMAAQINNTNASTAFVNNLLSVLLQIENQMVEQYQFIGGERLAVEYITVIVDSMAAEVERAG